VHNQVESLGHNLFLLWPVVVGGWVQLTSLQSTRLVFGVLLLIFSTNQVN